MIYADYAYYVEQYGGDMLTDEQAFNSAAVKASRYIDRLTMNRAESYQLIHQDDTSLKKACCAGAEQYFLISKARASVADEDGEISSESVGGHSVSYRSGLDTAAALEAELRIIVSSYLTMTGLLYRGSNYVHASRCYTDYS